MRTASSQPLSRQGLVPLQEKGRSGTRQKGGHEEEGAEKENILFGKLPEDGPSESLPVDDEDNDGAHEKSQNDPQQDPPQDDEGRLKKQHEDLLPVKKTEVAIEGELLAPLVEKKDEGVRDPEDRDHDRDRQKGVGDGEGLVENLKDPVTETVL